MYPVIPHWMYNPHCAWCETGWAEIRDGRVHKYPDVSKDVLCRDCRQDAIDACSILKAAKQCVEDIRIKAKLRRAIRLLEDRTQLLAYELLAEQSSEELFKIILARKVIHDKHCNCGAKV